MERIRFVAPLLIVVLFAALVGVALKTELTPKGDSVPVLPPSATTTFGEDSEEQHPGVAIGIAEEFQEASTTIRATDVLEDSRCPEGVQCIWAGTVRVAAVVSVDGIEENATLTLGTTTRVGNVLASLREVYPKKGEGTTTIDRYRFVFGAERVPPALPKGESGVRGILLVGPSCPVMREGEECPDRPAGSVSLVVAKEDGSVIARTTTKSDGSFLVLIPPGIYTISKEDGTPFPAVMPVAVTVHPATIEEVVVRGDSGIR